MTYQGIANQVGYKCSTVVSVIKKYVLNILDKRGGRNLIISKELKLVLLNQKLLEKWACYSLKQRCKLIHI